MANDKAFKVKNGLELGAYNAVIPSTAVDVFVYDTSKDSDGGAWRKRTQHTSWYNETLNTATRGSRREFPAVAVIVGESGKVTIYDGDDPSLPMWMVFNGAYSGTLFPALINFLAGGKGLSMLNGIIVGGRSYVSFVDDNLGGYWYTDGFYKNTGNGIANRNVNYAHRLANSSLAIVNITVNDVAMTVLPDAPIDPATGLPVPTIAVATAGGVSVIKDDGTVADITNSNSSYTTSFNVGFDSQNNLWLDQGSNSLSYNGWVYVFVMPLSGDTAVTLNSQTGSGDDPIAMFQRNVSSGGSIPFQVTGGDTLLANSNIATNGGLGILSVDYADSTKSMGAKITSSFNTGYQNGDIKGAFLADTDDTDLVASGELVTNGTFDTDVSGWLSENSVVTWNASGYADVDRNNLSYGDHFYQNITTTSGETYTVTFEIVALSNGVDPIFNGVNTATINATGTYTRTFVATGTTTKIAFAASQSVTATFSIDNISVKLAGADRSVNNNGLIVNGTITRSPVATGAELVAYSGFSASNYLEQPYNSDLDFSTGDFSVMFWIKNTGATNRIVNRQSASAFWNVKVNPSGYLAVDFLGSTGLTTTAPINIGVWQYVTLVRTGGVFYGYVDGVLVGSVANTLNFTDTDAILTVGRDFSGIEPLANGSLALLRISATAPTAEQIKKIYEDEKVLFQENAACTIYGASDAVTALAHDEDTGLLHVGTSAGRSVFQGLRRVSNTTTAVGTAISASGGLVVEE